MASLPPNTLVTNRYVPPGTYIGQIIKPAPSNLNADARVPAYIGKGSRLARGENLGIRRAFVFAEQLAFPLTAPFLANIANASDGSTDNPVRLFKQDGTQVRTDQWTFIQNAGVFNQVLINTDAFDPLATYYLDYQSTDRSVLDPVPVAELRQVINMGIAEGQNQFQEFQDYVIASSVSAPAEDAGNANTASNTSAVIMVSTGTGTMVADGASQFNHNYNRRYLITCTAASGVTPTRLATFSWQATPMSSGNGASQAVPLHSSEPAPTFVVDETNPTSFAQALEFGIVMDFAFGATNYVVSDTFQFDGMGPGLVEKDGRYDNNNQYVQLGNVTKSTPGGSTGLLTHDDNSNYNGIYNISYRVKCIAKSGVTPNRSATFVWAEAGESFANGTFVCNESNPLSLTQSLSHGIKLNASFGATNYSVGDVFSFQVMAPKIYYAAKDTRNVTIDVTSRLSGLTSGSIGGTYVADTPEGGFGLLNTTADTTRNPNDGLMQLPGNLKMFARNLFPVNRMAVGDKFYFTASDLEQISWNLNRTVSKEYEVSEVINDVLGVVTGNPNSYYVVLPFVPIPGTVTVRDATTGSILSSTEITGTAFVGFLTNPNVRLAINFEWRGGEPDPGQLYYMTALFLRPDNLYNNPQLALSKDEGRRLLAPLSAQNHLLIMNDIAFENNTPACYFVQVKDADSDGIYTTVDFKAALESTKRVSRITDRVVLSSFGSWADQLAINLYANDPFQKKESLDWFGAPIGTPIGSPDLTNSLVFLASKSLQVYGNSPAHGTRILVAPTECTRTITLDNGLSQLVTLDGSFVAGGLAALAASFADPSETILRKTLAGYDSIQVYSEPEDLILGTNQIVYMSNQGANIFRVEEDVTVDHFAQEFSEISAMTQKQAVTKIVRREMDLAIISIVTPSSQASQQLIRAALSSILVGLVSRGVVADYQDANGNVRKFDPNADILVFQDASDKTLFRFIYAYYIKYPIKRLFGLYQVDSNDFSISA